MGVRVIAAGAPVIVGGPGDEATRTVLRRSASVSSLRPPCALYERTNHRSRVSSGSGTTAVALGLPPSAGGVPSATFSGPAGSSTQTSYRGAFPSASQLKVGRTLTTPSSSGVTGSSALAAADPASARPAAIAAAPASAETARRVRSAGGRGAAALPDVGSGGSHWDRERIALRPERWSRIDLSAGMGC